MGYYSGSSQPSGSAMDEWKRGASQLLDSAATKEQPETVESENGQDPGSEAPAAATAVERSVEVQP